MRASLTVGQLRAALEGVPDHLDVVVRATDERSADGDVFVCGGIVSAGVESHHDDYFAIDADADAQPEGEAGR